MSLFFFFFLLVLTLTLIPISQQRQIQSAPQMNAYDVLRSHGLPIGLLPKDIEEFTVDDAGQFEVRLRSPCTAKFETGVHYESVITGTISYGLITSLSGISAQELFLWFPVHQIRVDVPSSGLIYFDVGVIYKQFSLALFDTPPLCTPQQIRVGDKLLDFSETTAAAAAVM